MIECYVDCTEYKRLIEEQKIRPAALKAFFKTKNIFLTSNNSKKLSEEVYTIFMGVRDLSDFQELLYGSNTYEKSLIFEIATPNNDEDILDVITQSINARRSAKMGEYNISRPIKTDADITLEMVYYKKTAGKNKIFEYEPRNLRVYIRKNSEHKAIVDIRQQSSYDASRVINLFDGLRKVDNEPNLFNIKRLNFGLLNKENRVKFFDLLMEHKFNQWKIKTVTALTVKKYELSEEDDSSSEEEITGDENNNLSGISQAILNGQGLRNNEFVQKCIAEGFYISSMKLRYYNSKESNEFIININFKGEDLKVDMCQTFIEEDDVMTLHPFMRDEQDIIIREFQDTAKSIYNQLIEEQNI